MTDEIKRAEAKKIAAEKQIKKDAEENKLYEAQLSDIKKKYNISDEQLEVAKDMTFELTKIYYKEIEVKDEEGNVIGMEKTDEILKTEVGKFNLTDGKIYMKYFLMLNEEQKVKHINFMKVGDKEKAIKVFEEILI